MVFLLTILTDITNRTRPFSYYSGVSLDHWMLRLVYGLGMFRRRQDIHYAIISVLLYVMDSVL